MDVRTTNRLPARPKPASSSRWCQADEARSQHALAELMAACRKMTEEELPRIAKLVRATDRVHALRRLAEASTAFYLAVERAAFRLGLERRDRPAEEGPKAGRWAW